MKKALTIVLVILVLAVIGGGIYFFIQKKNSGQSLSPTSFFGFGGSPSSTGGEPRTDVVVPAPSPGGNESSAIGADIIQKIANGPIAGFGVDTDTSGNTIVRYQDKALGHISEVFLPKNVPSSIPSATEATVYESLWGKGGDDVITRTIGDGDVIKTTALRISSQKSFSFPDNTSAIVLSPDKRNVFSLSPSGQGSTGFVSNMDGTGQKKTFTSSFSEWLASWTSPSTITLTSKPSARATGSIYLLNTKTFSSQIAVAGKTGLTGTLSSDAKTVVYTESTPGGMRTSYYTVATGKTPLAPFTTVPEKCAWSTKEIGVIFCAIPSSIPAGEYPDDWYKGVVSFSDSIWKFDTRNSNDLGRVVISHVPENSVDAISLTLDPNESYLLFINKKDGALWAIDLSLAAPADSD